MKLPLRLVAAVVQRLDRQMARPSLFNDRMPPHRLRARMTRLQAWLGPMGWHMAIGWTAESERWAKTPRMLARCGELVP